MSAALDVSTATVATPQNGWPDSLRSPVSGQWLHQDGPHSLSADGERWPVIDGIAYLRTGREGLVAAALEALDCGETARATALLLRDRADAAAADEPASLEAVRMLVARCDRLGFREAMRGLGLGDAADYFAHRWSDPTFLSGLALAESHWTVPARVLDIGCGAGQFLRAAAHHAPELCGGDIVFAHLWLARHFVAPTASLVCFDAARPWPIADGAADMVVCHDTLHLISDQGRAIAEMRRVAGDGAILCGHVRQDAADPLAVARLFGAATVYDDAELTAALIAQRAPRPRAAGTLADVAALAVAAGSIAARPARPVLGQLATPPRGAALRLNPLYCEEADGACVRRFPSQHYAETIGRLATYPSHVAARGRVIAGADPADDALIRRRVWVDLPPRW